MSALPVLLLDGHNDALLALERVTREGRPADFFAGVEGMHLDWPKARAGGFAGGFFACFVPPDLAQDAVARDDVIVTEAGWEVPYAAALDPSYARGVAVRLVARLLELEAASGGRLRIARSAAEVEDCLRDGAIAAIPHLEGAEPIDPGLDLLHVLHAAGLRSLGLVWSRPNAFGHGVPFRFPSTPDVGPGLTEAGRRLVRRCNALGVLVDCAHLNERGFWDVARCSDAPLVVTHAAAHALTPTARNLTDAQIDAVGASGGIVGINLSVSDLREDGRDDPDVALGRWVAHAEHVAGRIGVEHVALGSDFDGASVPIAVGDASGLPRLLDALVDARWTGSERRALAHQNWLRVMRATWGA